MRPYRTHFRLIFFALLLPSLAFAMTSEFVLNSVTAVPAVTWVGGAGVQRGTATVDYTTPVLIQTAATGITMKVNGTGTGVPIVASVPHKFQPGGSVTSLVFYQTSSAGGFTVYVVK